MARPRGKPIYVPMLPADGPDREETPFTRARSRLMHPTDRGITLELAKSYAAEQLGPLKSLVARLVQRPDGTVGAAA